MSASMTTTTESHADALARVDNAVAFLERFREALGVLRASLAKLEPHTHRAEAAGLDVAQMVSANLAAHQQMLAARREMRREVGGGEMP